MLDSIKAEMGNHLGERVTIIFNAGRNKTEEFNAVITAMYNSIFTVKIDNNVNETKSFMYTDILTETVAIYYK